MRPIEKVILAHNIQVFVGAVGLTVIAFFEPRLFVDGQASSRATVLAFSVFAPLAISGLTFVVVFPRDAAPRTIADEYSLGIRATMRSGLCIFVGSVLTAAVFSVAYFWVPALALRRSAYHLVLMLSFMSICAGCFAEVIYAHILIWLLNTDAAGLAPVRLV